MKVENVIILAAGNAVRMRPLSEYLPKCLVPIHGKPIIYHHIERLRRIGAKRIFITLNKKRGHLIESAIKEIPGGWDDIVFVKQDEILGQAYSLLMCSGMVNGPFAYVLGDELSLDDTHINKFIERDDMENAVAVMKPRKREKILEKTSVHFNKSKKEKEQWLIDGFIMKPTQEEIASPYCTANFYVFDRDFFEVARTVVQDKSSYRMTKSGPELYTDVIVQELIKQGKKITPLFVDGEHIHVNSMKDIGSVYRHVDVQIA